MKAGSPAGSAEGISHLPAKLKKKRSCLSLIRTNTILSKQTTRNHAVIAALWMSGTLVSFMAMAIGGRELSAQLSTFQILLFRSIIGLLIVGFLLWRSNWRQILTKHLWVHILRNISHFGGQFGWFYGIAFIPLAEVFALEFTVPVWTAVLATVLLREQITRARVAAETALNDTSRAKERAMGAIRMRTPSLTLRVSGRDRKRAIPREAASTRVQSPQRREK